MSGRPNAKGQKPNATYSGHEHVAFSIWLLAFGLWRLAFGVWPYYDFIPGSESMTAFAMSTIGTERS